MAKQRSMGFIDFTDHDRQTDGQGYHVTSRSACHTTHPALEIGGGTLIGGNCVSGPNTHYANLYVALAEPPGYPLFDPGKPLSQCVYYPIKNMEIPSRPDKFAALIDHILFVLKTGGIVHVGCIGGHGRTGMVIAAVVARLGIAGTDNDAIGWTRAHYCKKAVETKEQEGFIAVNFGAALPTASKTPYEKG